MIPALGFFVPFAIRCKMRARCKLSPKQWLGEHSGRLQTSSKEAQCSSFNRLSIAYLRLNILEADCSAREGNRAGVAVRAAALFPFAQSVVNIPCWHTPKLYGRRF